MRMKKKYIDKYHDLSLQVKSSLWVTISNFLQRGITMITTPIFTRGLSTYEYGVVSTYNAWNTLLYMLISLCLYKSLMNLYNKYSDKEKTLTYLLGLEFTITSVWVIVLLIFKKQFALLLQLPELLVVLLAITIVSQGAIDCWMIYKRYIYDYRSALFVSVLQSTISTIVAAILVFFVSPTAEFRIIPQATISLMIAMCIYYFYFSKKKIFFDKSIWCFSLCFCGSLMPHYLSEFVLNASDKLMINAMCTKSDVAIYSIAYSVGSLIVLVTSAINVSFSPYRYQKLKAKEYKALSITTTKVMSVVSFFLMFVMLFGYEIVYIFGGEKYKEAVSIIIPICFGVYFNYMFQIFAGVQEYYEKKKSIVVASVSCALVNIILNYIFIKCVGYKAASYTTFFCYALFCFIHYIFYKNLCKEQIGGVEIYNIRQLLFMSFVVIIMGILVSILNNFILLKYIVILFMGILGFVKRINIISFFKNMFN